MDTKEEVAKRIAESHYEVDSGVTQIYRIRVSPEREADPKEPIRLLEVYQYAIPSGIAPVWLPPHPASGVPFPAIVVQLAPQEFEQLGGSLKLPDDWRVDELPIAPPSGHPHGAAR